MHGSMTENYSKPIKCAHVRNHEYIVAIAIENLLERKTDRPTDGRVTDKIVKLEGGHIDPSRHICR